MLTFDALFVDEISLRYPSLIHFQVSYDETFQEWQSFIWFISIELLTIINYQYAPKCNGENNANYDSE